MLDTKNVCVKIDYPFGGISRVLLIKKNDRCVNFFLKVLVTVREIFINFVRENHVL